LGNRWGVGKGRKKKITFSQAARKKQWAHREKRDIILVGLESVGSTLRREKKPKEADGF